MDHHLRPVDRCGGAAKRRGRLAGAAVARPGARAAQERQRDGGDPGSAGQYRHAVLQPSVPPFNDVRARRAILMALNQADYMRAYVPDDKMWKPLPGYFPPGTPLYNEEGGEILKG